MAVEYVTSKNMCNLIYEMLRLMDKSMAHHGRRVSYIMSKMLECRGAYEKYEIADFMVLAMLHDIGAYKTDDVRKQLSYEAKNPYHIQSMGIYLLNTYHLWMSSRK